MPTEPDRTRARQLAKESLEAGDPAGWFERLYRESDEGRATVPWADMEANPNLTSWWSGQPGIELAGRSALVVGCGYGDDAEQLAEWGAEVTAFDVAPTAIASARRRFPETHVDYQSADLFRPPADWTGRFDFVFECFTLQALPEDVRTEAIKKLAGFVAPGGHLLLIARGRDACDPPGDMPWPLVKEELDEFERFGLTPITKEDYIDAGSTRRFRVLYRRF
jgi:SAM-dependent methyltransferase